MTDEERKKRKRKYQNEYYEKKKDRLREYGRDYYHENKDRMLEYQRRWRRENKDRMLECQRRRREEKRREVQRRAEAFKARWMELWDRDPRSVVARLADLIGKHPKMKGSETSASKQ